MSDTAPVRRHPWFGVPALLIALGLLRAVQFLTTPEGQSWFEDLARPLGHAAMGLALVGPLIFLGAAVLVFGLAVGSAARREPYRLGELALTIVLAIVFQLTSSHAEVWTGFPIQLLVAGVLVFGTSAGVRWLWRKVRSS